MTRLEQELIDSYKKDFVKTERFCHQQDFNFLLVKNGNKYLVFNEKHLSKMHKSKLPKDYNTEFIRFLKSLKEHEELTKRFSNGIKRYKNR